MQMHAYVVRIHETRLPEFLAWSSPGAPRREGGLPIDKPGLDIDTRDQCET